MSSEYYVIAPDGNEYGPADVQTLAQWGSEGRVTPTTELKLAGSDIKIPAASVPGLFPDQTLPFTPYHQPTADTGDKDILNAFILGSTAICVCAPITGPLGIYYANEARKKNHGKATVAMAYCVVMMLLGTVVIVINWLIPKVAHF